MSWRASTRLRAAAIIPVAAVLVACLAVPAVAAGRPTAGRQPQAAGPQLTSTPLFAYFYQWFDPSSWNRAKIDYPKLGRYSSDDVSVMRQQISWAKQVGITGFIVSWKSTPVNNRRLQALMTVAAQQNYYAVKCPATGLNVETCYRQNEYLDTVLQVNVGSVNYNMSTGQCAATSTSAQVCDDTNTSWTFSTADATLAGVEKGQRGLVTVNVGSNMNPNCQSVQLGSPAP